MHSDIMDVRIEMCSASEHNGRVQMLTYLNHLDTNLTLTVYIVLYFYLKSHLDKKSMVNQFIILIMWIMWIMLLMIRTIEYLN